MVTGASGGIGQAVIGRLARDGARVAGLDLQQPDTEGIVYAATVDVTDENKATEAMAGAVTYLGGIDVLVALAGIQVHSPTHELPVASFRKVLEVSAVGTFLTVRAALPRMLDAGSGRIVTFGSTAAVCSAPELAAYAAAKGAVLQFTRSIAAEYAARGIVANCVCPGGTMTPMLREIDANRTTPDNFKARHPIGRYADPDEIAAVVAFLSSAESSFMVGATVMVDGGYSIG